MAVFPTLSVVMSTPGYSDTIAQDPTLRNSTDDGYVITRAKFTRLTHKYSVPYNTITNTDKSTLETFQASVGVGAGSFTWTEPSSGVDKTVQFTKPITFNKNGLFWDAAIELEEV